VRTGEAPAGPEFAYTGAVLDDGTGLYHMNARYYDPDSATFLTRDSYRGDPQDPTSLNGYAYCTGNPISYTDPTGHKKYNVNNAVKYAKKWYNDHNPKYPNNEESGGDCANFGSQILHAGGVKMDKKNGWYATKWGCGPNWENANNLYKYLKKKKKWKTASMTRKQANADSDVYPGHEYHSYWRKAKKGDIIFWGSETTGKIQHTTFVLLSKPYNPNNSNPTGTVLAAHTYSTNNTFFYQYFKTFTKAIRVRPK
jgi:RHS repeat-associated protein